MRFAAFIAAGIGLAALSLPACKKGEAQAVPTPPTSARSEAGLEARSVTAGGVQVLITPAQLDDEGAVFDISMQTHSGDLGSNLNKTARLEVGGTAWSGASWTGDPPGGHHREGTLSFEPSGAASGAAILTIGGFPEPVEASWTLGG